MEFVVGVSRRCGACKVLGDGGMRWVSEDIFGGIEKRRIEDKTKG